MTLTEKLLYLADYIDDSRSFENCVILRRYFWGAEPEGMSMEARMTLLCETLLLSFDMTVRDLLAEGAPVSVETMEARNALLLEAARAKGFLPVITTNGSLLCERGEALLASLPYKISISLHAPEANAAFAAEGYWDACVGFAKEAAERGCIIALRLWNLGSGADNSHILDFLHASFPGEWRDIRGGSSQRLAERIFLEWGERFDWPDPALPECPPDTDLFCYGLRDQIGILVDGTVVPCCLDADANLSLGNLFESELDDILASPRAKAIYDGFTRRRACESLCRKCGYAKRFSRG
jgi:radical SAM protein with 4Fe4S-binding SPASM domain